AAAGSPGHFPVTGVPGGVIAPLDRDSREACLALLPDALAAARRVAESALTRPAQPDDFHGADVALTDSLGNVDLFGTKLRAVMSEGGLVIDGAPAGQYDQLVAEADPGSSAPRPYLVPLGAGSAYRVGPVAQLRAGSLTTPVADDLSGTWLIDGFPGGASAARAIIVVHAVEAIGDLLADDALLNGPVALPWPETLPAGVGVGWVDGARGLLVHRYKVGDDGRIVRATILTPTAQNEPWLDGLLTSAVATGNNLVVEDAIREADPCLPCSSAPAGTMDLVIDEVKG
ncbi:MAG: hypothetical protein FWD63_07275, partial [Propionibacteriaceae bacterium]|nr:hypothetical protein [Propionibacteriaceae bacterium]